MPTKKITIDQIIQLVNEIRDAKNLGTLDARVADDCILSLGVLIFKDYPKEE